MSKPNFTIYDVAKEAKVSITTVSRVLNAPEKVNPETRAAVLAVIQRLGFVPRADARARALRKNHQVGIITPLLSRHTLFQRLRGATHSLTQLHYETVMYQVESETSLVNQLEFLSLNHYFEGLIVFSLPIPENVAAQLLNTPTKLVLVDFQLPQFSSVFSDDARGGRLAANFLYSKGHRRFGFIGSSSFEEFGLHQDALRLRGFREELKRLKMQLRSNDILQLPQDLESATSMVISYLKRENHPTAVFAVTDLQGIAVMRAARDLGIRFPRDLAILGFGNLDLADYVGLTTIDQHLEESGRASVELLISRISDASRSVRHIQLPLNIIERETV